MICTEDCSLQIRINLVCKAHMKLNLYLHVQLFDTVTVQMIASKQCLIRQHD
jgi:hypothetical protein